MKTLQDWGQLLVSFGAVPAGLVGLFKWTYEMRANRRQRANELRWKQAQASRELLDDIHNHELAKQAVHMMDWSDGSAEYKINDDLKMTITYPEVLKALALNEGDVCTAWQAYIRDCFDWFFYRVDRIEHYIRRGLIQFEDVKDVFSSYAREVAAHKDVFEKFFQFHRYHLAREFFTRYSAGF